MVLHGLTFSPNLLKDRQHSELSGVPKQTQDPGTHTQQQPSDMELCALGAALTKKGSCLQLLQYRFHQNTIPKMLPFIPLTYHVLLRFVD